MIAYRLFCIISLTIIFNSCATIDDSIFRQELAPINNNQNTLEGRYSNLALHYKQERLRGSINVNVDSKYFFWNSYKSVTEYSDSEKELQKVSLVFVKENLFNVSLISENRIIKTKKIKGKWKDGYFYSKPSFFFSPLFPLLYGYATSRMRLSINEEGNLICEVAWNEYVGNIIGGIDSKGQSIGVFEKK